jgi:DNA-binding transcriptional LysR family regulator
MPAERRAIPPLKIVLGNLCYLVAAAEKRSFRQAAIELEVWESTISRGIRDLENEIGVALFIRQPGGVTLTNAGSKFLNHARTAVGRIEYALKDAGAAGRGEVGMVRIGIFSSLASGFLADLLQAYQAKNPFVHLDFAEGGPAEHVAAIQHHRMDVAFLTGEPAAYGCEAPRLWEERVFVVLPKDHFLVEREEIGWDDLRDEHFIVSETNPGPEIHDYLVKHLAELGHHPAVERCGVGRDNLMKLVTLGRGLYENPALAKERARTPHRRIVAVSIRGGGIEVYFFVTWPRISPSLWAAVWMLKYHLLASRSLA